MRTYPSINDGVLYVVFTPLFPTTIDQWGLDVMAGLAEHWPHVWDIDSLFPSRVKALTYKIDICHFLALCSALIL